MRDSIELKEYRIQKCNLEKTGIPLKVETAMGKNKGEWE